MPDDLGENFGKYPRDYKHLFGVDFNYILHEQAGLLPNRAHKSPSFVRSVCAMPASCFKKPVGVNADTAY